jgi:hypothetical protein
LGARVRRRPDLYVLGACDNAIIERSTASSVRDFQVTLAGFSTCDTLRTMRDAVAVLVLLIACGGDSTPADAGDATAAEAGEDCGPIFMCCSACDDDTPTGAICVDGQRACPSGLKPESDLICPCYSVKCVTPPYRPQCVACDGGGALSTCDVDANVFVCPAGMHSVDDLDASCD